MAEILHDFHSWRRSETSVSAALCQQGYAAYDAGDDGEAFRLFSRGAQLGYAEAQFMLGHCYKAGIGVDSNTREAERWLTKAQEKGFPVALFQKLFDRMDACRAAL